MKIVKFVLINLLVTVLAAEIMLRLFGFTALWKYDLAAEPRQCILPDAEMGFVLNPGTFRVTINRGLAYEASHRQSFPFLISR